MRRWRLRPACRQRRSRRSAPAPRRNSRRRIRGFVFQFVTELLDTKRLGDATFAAAIAAFGETGVVELGTMIGYYTAIGNALNAFEVALPNGTAPYFRR